MAESTNQYDFLSELTKAFSGFKMPSGSTLTDVLKYQLQLIMNVMDGIDLKKMGFSDEMVAQMEKNKPEVKKRLQNIIDNGLMEELKSELNKFQNNSGNLADYFKDLLNREEKTKK